MTAKKKQLPRELATLSAPEAMGMDGTQAIRRAIAMLKVVATRGVSGITHGEVADAMQLSRSTAHRILKALVDEGLLDQNESQSRYTIGRLAYELSLSTATDYHSSLGWNRAVDAVARRTDHTSYLIARSGLEAICIQKAEGRGPLRVIPVDVGQRRPIGVGAGGIALMSGFEPQIIERVAAAIAPVLKQFPGISQQQVIQDATDAKRLGYSVSRGRVFSEVVGVGVLIPMGKEPKLALSIAAPASLMDATRIKATVTIIKEEIRGNLQLAS